MRDLCEADVVQRKHVAVPLEPTRIHVGAYVARRRRTKVIGPTGIVGPGECMGGGVLGPVGNTNSQCSLPFYRQQIQIFLSCGTNLFHPFFTQCCGSWSIRSNARKDTRFWSTRSNARFWSTRSQSYARDKCATVDLITEIQQLWLNFVISESWSDTQMHADAPMKIKRQKWKRSGAHVMGSWPTYRAQRDIIVAVQASLSKTYGPDFSRLILL